MLCPPVPLTRARRGNSETLPGNEGGVGSLFWVSTLCVLIFEGFPAISLIVWCAHGVV